MIRAHLPRPLPGVAAPERLTDLICPLPLEAVDPAPTGAMTHPLPLPETAARARTTEQVQVMAQTMATSRAALVSSPFIRANIGPTPG